MSEQAHPIRIGCSGWSYPDWEGVFYPEDNHFSGHAPATAAALQERLGRERSGRTDMT
jgi:uncharacterized protein YecE (DUF72 family)